MKPIAEIDRTIPVLDHVSTRYRIRLEGEQQWRRVMIDNGVFYVNIRRKPVVVTDDRITP